MPTPTLRLAPLALALFAAVAAPVAHGASPRPASPHAASPHAVSPETAAPHASHGAAASAAKTASNGLDAAAKAKLVGRHRLTLQWLGWGDLNSGGQAVVEDRGDTLWLAGEHKGQGENAGDYLRLSGTIVSAGKDGFVFVGEILTKVNHIAEGTECKRSGTFTFKTKGSRKYWRMQEMTNPCDPVTDYVDVYFRGI